MAARPRPRATPARATPARPIAAARPRRPTWLGGLVVALAALAAYANSLGNGFVWDDPIIVSRQLVVFRTLGDVLAPPRDIPQFSPDYYRPLTIATYLIDRAVGGERPFAFHLSVVLTHALASLLVWALAAQLLASAATPAATVRMPRSAAAELDHQSPMSFSASGADPAAWLAGLLFALHPVHTESVAWAAGRSDVLATMGLLAALVAHGRWPWSWRGAGLSGLAGFGALGAKEAGVALYPLLLLRDVVVAGVRRPLVDWLRGYTGVGVAGVIYLLLRRHALGEVVGTASRATSVSRAPLEIAAAVGAYLRELLWPWPLNAYVDAIPGGPLPAVLVVAYLSGLGLSAWRWWRRRDGLPLFCLLWVGLTLVPSLAILWKIPDAPLAERYLYLPSVGFCLLVGDLGGRAWRGARRPAVRTGLLTAAALVLLFAGGATVARNPVWHDDLALWSDTEAKSQVSGMAARNLGTAYQQIGRPDEARAAFARALARRNDARGLQTIHNNLGTMAMMDGDFAAAQRSYEQALAGAPDASDTLFNLGLAILQGGGATPDAARRALPSLERAGVLNPHDADIETGLGQAYLILGERDRAIEHLRRALELNPSAHTAQGARTLLQQAGAG
ncbi:MAG: tetratricopeptide repeat protein [bacterium]